MNKLTVFDFKTAKDFFKYTWEDKKGRNPSFTLRAWAQQLGFKSHNSLYRIIQGTRPMPKSLLPALRASLRLKEREINYLETLVDLEKSKTPNESKIYLDRLEKLSPKGSYFFTNLSNYEFFRDPARATIAELVLTKNFTTDPRWIQKQILFKRSLAQIKAALENLKEIGIVKEEDGRLKRVNKKLSTTNDIKSLALREYHKSLCEIAAEQIEKQELGQREYNGFIFNIKNKEIKKAKERLRLFVKEFSDEFEAKQGEDALTYCLQANLFSLVNHKEKK